MDELNFRVVHVYGLTETYGPITVCPEQDGVADAAAGRAGAAALRARARRTRSADLVRVVDERRCTTCPRDGETMGEVVMRGNNVMARLLRRPGGDGDGVPRRLVPLRRPRRVAPGRERSSCATAARTSSSPAARTSRRSRSSRPSSPHPAVLECAVVAIPHEHWGERPKAFVTLRDGATATARSSSRSAASASRTTSARTRSSSARCRRRRPARCRSTCCATQEWAGHETRIGAA